MRSNFVANVLALRCRSSEITHSEYQVIGYEIGSFIVTELYFRHNIQSSLRIDSNRMSLAEIHTIGTYYSC